MKVAAKAVIPLLLLVAAAALAASQRAQVEALPERWKRWLEQEVYPLITSEQRKAFLALETDAQREEFVERLWQLWSSQSGRATCSAGPGRSASRRRARSSATPPRTAPRPAPARAAGRAQEDRLHRGLPAARVLALRLHPRARPGGDDRLLPPLRARPVPPVGAVRDPRRALQHRRPDGDRQADRHPVRPPEWRCGDANEILGCSPPRSSGCATPRPSR